MVWNYNGYVKQEQVGGFVGLCWMNDYLVGIY